MPLNLLNMVSKFAVANDQESATAFYRTHVPWVAPQAYLNIIYKSAAEDLIIEAARRLKIPGPFSEFLRMQNGARLFSGALNILGVVRTGQLLNRRDPFSLPPFNIEREYASWTHDRERLLPIGGYGFDGSTVCMDRHLMHIEVFHRDKKKAYVSWPNLDMWIEDEVKRLSILFDAKGKCLVDESATLPQATKSQ